MFDPPGALRLRYLTGPQRGSHAVLRPPRIRIGRSRDNDIVLADRDGAQSSGHHAEAVREGRQWFIHDLQSTNGTWLNGARISRAPFNAGDRLRFGDVECEVLPGRFAYAIGAAAAVAFLAVAVGTFAFFSARGRGFETVATTIARSVYLVAIDRESGRQIIGTSFVVGEGLLATNAHVADSLEPAIRRGEGRAVIVRSDTGEVGQITDAYLSASWRKGTVADDVALLRAMGVAEDAKPLRLADPSRVAALTRGTTLATFGFPASSTDAHRPRGRLAVDVLGDVRDGRYLAVGLRIAPGTSGSPIFLDDASVIGLVVGGDFAKMPDGSVNPSGTNVNWGIAVGPLHQLLQECAAADAKRR